MELPIINTYINFFSPSFLLLHSCSFVCFGYVYGLEKIGVYNTLASKTYVKLPKPSKNSDSNAQHFPFGFANTFMISLHALCTPRLPIPLYCHE
jgi:hypothetical protein